MMKKILIGLVILAVLLVTAFLYLNYRNRTLSPPGEASFSQGELNIEVKYSRPSVRERLIFGAEADGALQPYGSYWRLGANEATTIKINKDILLNDKPLAAGKYAIYAVPGAQEFIIGVNSESDRWGYSEPDYGQDLFTTVVPVQHLDQPIEQVTARFEEMENGAYLVFEWSDVRLFIPIKLDENS